MDHKMEHLKLKSS